MILFEKYNFKIYNTRQFSKRLPKINKTSFWYKYLDFKF